MKILTFGEILWDVYPDKAYIGGAPLNFSAHLAKHNESVSLLSCVGNDELGQKTLDQLKMWNVDTEYISVLDDKETGKSLVSLDENMVPKYIFKTDVAYEYIRCNKSVKAFDCLYFGTLALQSDCNLNAIESLVKNNDFTDIFVDLNIRAPLYNKKTVRFAVENATVLKISDEEMPEACKMLGIETVDYKTAAKMIAQKYVKMKYVIVTLGAEGAYLYDRATKEEISCEGKRVEAISTVGAGDSFFAGFVHTFLKGEKLVDCLEYAIKLSAFVVSKLDAVPEYEGI